MTRKSKTLHLDPIRVSQSGRVRIRIHAWVSGGITPGHLERAGTSLVKSDRMGLLTI